MSSFSDGFTGNALLKSIEGTAEVLLGMLKNGLLNSGVKVKLGAAMVKPALKEVMSFLTRVSMWGASLMGLEGSCRKGSRRADARAVYYTLKQIDTMLTQQLTEQSLRNSKKWTRHC